MGQFSVGANSALPIGQKLTVKRYRHYRNSIRNRRIPLNHQGLCQQSRLLTPTGSPEAIALLQDQQFTPDVTRILRNIKAAHQVKSVELMVASNTITVANVGALLKATPTEQLADVPPAGTRQQNRTHGATGQAVERDELGSANRTEDSVLSKANQRGCSVFTQS